MMATTMLPWHAADEFEMPLWVAELDAMLYSVEHRRLCVWLDELDGRWRWEVQTYHHSGVAAEGSAGTTQEAMLAAEAAARQLAATPDDGGRP